MYIIKVLIVLPGFQLLFMILCECLSAAHTNILLHARMWRFTHSMFRYKGFCVNSNSSNLLLFVMNNRNGSTYISTVHRHVQCFDISRGLGDRVRLRRPGEPHVCSYHMIKLWLSIGCGLSHDYLSGETVCGGWEHKMCHVIRWDTLYSLFTFWCSFILGEGILL